VKHSFTPPACKVSFVQSRNEQLPRRLRKGLQKPRRPYPIQFRTDIIHEQNAGLSRHRCLVSMLTQNHRRSHEFLLPPGYPPPGSTLMDVHLNVTPVRAHHRLAHAGITLPAGCQEVAQTRTGRLSGTVAEPNLGIEEVLPELQNKWFNPRQNLSPRAVDYAAPNLHFLFPGFNFPVLCPAPQERSPLPEGALISAPFPEKGLFHVKHRPIQEATAFRRPFRHEPMRVRVDNLQRHPLGHLGHSGRWPPV
jgi:hypothetical protein